MVKIPTPDYIGFLVGRKYPDTVEPLHPMARALASNGIVYDEEEDWEPPAEATVQKAQQYREKLQKLSKPEIKKLYKDELSKKHHEDDQRRFFNQPDAEADFDYWAKIPGWKVDEAVALTLGKNPKIVNKERLEKLYASPFAEKYSEVREMVSRSRSAGLFTGSTIVLATDHIIPHKFVRWAQNADIGFPQELAEKVLSFYEANKPPKTAFEMSMERLEQSMEKSANDKGPLTQRVENLLEERKRKLPKIDTPKPKPLHTKEKETLLKMIAGMAVDAYGYDPSASRSPIPKELADVLAEKGIPLDPDTVRKWLKEAAELLPSINLGDSQ